MKLLGRRSSNSDIIQAIERAKAEILDEIVKLRSDLALTFRDEMDPVRQEMSKRLGNRMIEKLKAEDWARRLTVGDQEP